LTSKCEELD